MTIQILLTADNHLDPPAVSFGPKRFERRRDHLRCFEEVIDYAKRERPDFLFLCGDAFDTIRPGNYVRARVMEDLRSIHDLGVEILAVSGDHDTPKVADDGSSPLAVYGNSGFVHFFDDLQKICHRNFRIRGIDVDVAGLGRNPFIKSGIDPLHGLEAEFTGEVNILLTHYPIEGFVGYARDDPVIRLSSFPQNCQLVCVGHFHSFQTKEMEHTTIVYPGSTERASFQEENEEKGFVWLELDKEGIIDKKHVKTSARRFKTITESFPTNKAPIESLKQVLDESKDLHAVVRLKLRGRVNVEQLGAYRRSELLMHGEDKFFHLTIDESDLEIETTEPLPALQRTTPLEELRSYFRRKIEAATEDEEKSVLEDALQLCVAKLEEAGAW